MGNVILLVDDDNDVREVTTLILQEKGYHVIAVENGKEALNYMNENGDIVDTIIIDRNMPVMNGIEFIEEHAKSKYSYIPSILLTSSGSPDEITEGFEAGAYSYIIKPAKIELIDSIAKAAIRDMHQYKTLNDMATQQRDLKIMLENMSLKLKTFKQARSLSRFLSGFYPDPKKAIIGIYEIIVNAIEHGNLEIDYDHKKELIKAEKWDEEIVTRQESNRYKNRYVKISFTITNSMIQLKVVDEGAGFNWENFTSARVVKPNEPSGRGILMAQQLSFDEILYLGKGNVVECNKYLDYTI